MPNKSPYHFEMSERKLLLRFLDVVLPLLGLHFIGDVFGFNYFIIAKENWQWSVLLAVYILFFGSIFENYDLRKSSNFYKILRSIVLSSAVVVLFYLLTPFITPVLPDNRIQILYFFVTIVVTTALGRLLYISLINSPKFVKNVLIIANGNMISEIEKGLHEADQNYKIKYYINTTPNIPANTQLKEVSQHQIEEVVLKGIQEIVVTQNSKFSSPYLYEQLLKLFNSGYVIKDYTQVYEDLTGKVFVSFVDDELFKQFPFNEYNNKPLYRVFHRLFDVIISIIGLAVFLLMIPIVYVINLFANKGPLFYTQTRVGANGKEFIICKLRSMVVNAEKEGAVWSTKNDMRITPFGKFLRKTRMDEFPQFYNILKGDMSVIGPRPERPVFVKQLSKEISFYPTRHIVKPGLTGWAQVNTAYASTLEGSLEKLQYDLYYIKHRNVFLDFNIMIRTLTTVLHFRGQ